MNWLILLAIIVAIIILFAVGVRMAGGNFTLVEDWKKAYRYYSTWALGLVALSPDIFNALVAGDYLGGTPVGDRFSAWIKLAAAGTFVLRMVRQAPKPKSPFDETDSAGA